MTIAIKPSLTTRVDPTKSIKAYPCFVPTSNYAEVTIDHTKLSGDVTDVVIPLTGRDLAAGFWTAVDADGLNIIVTDAHSGRVLRRQVPHINKVSETLEVYTRLPRIASDVDTDLLLSVAPYSLAQDMLTWPTGWKFASDFSDYNSGTQIRDWSQYGNHGTKGTGAAAPTEVAGVVGRAQEFVLENNTRISCGDIDTNETTIIVAYKPTVVPTTNYGTVVAKGQATATSQSWWLAFRAGNASYGFLRYADNSDYTYPPATVNVVDTWYVRAMTVVPALATEYYNGEATGSQVPADGKEFLYQSATPVTLGGIGAVSYSSSLVISELYIASFALSADEITAYDAALRGTATFYGVTNHF